jgi:hypothetical protein
VSRPRESRLRSDEGNPESCKREPAKSTQKCAALNTSRESVDDVLSEHYLTSF